MSVLKVCPTCGIEYPETERFCPKDGAALHWQGGANTDLVGSIIADRYHILKRLGAGGMGRVYLAEHVKMGRQCALKVLHPAMAGDAEAIGRFNREAANASRIEHPNVAAIYDFGETQDGLLYLAMQYVEGRTLTGVLAGGDALPPLRACEIARQTAEGLHAAHALGIVHRDLKPDNIMLSTDADGIDIVKVVDFGIAKASGEGSQGVTRTGVVVGTPEYMSPEQLAGEPVDSRSDLYSLALITFNMLTGELPFPAVSTGTLVVMRLTEQPRTLAAARPDIAWPDELQAVMTRALDRLPEARYASTREFVHALHAAAAMMPARSTVGQSGPAEIAPSRAPTRVVSPMPASEGAVETPLDVGRRVVRTRARTIAAGLALVAFLLIAMGSRGAIRRARASAALDQGIAALRAGRHDVAKERLVAATTYAPGDPAPHVQLSRLAREMNDLAAANDEAVKAVKLGPDDPSALRELATTLYAMQNFTAARAFYARAIKANPADRVSQGYLGCSLIQLGRADEGKRWLARAGSGTWSACAGSQ